MKELGILVIHEQATGQLFDIIDCNSHNLYDQGLVGVKIQKTIKRTPGYPFIFPKPKVLYLLTPSAVNRNCLHFTLLLTENRSCI